MAARSLALIASAAVAAALCGACVQDDGRRWGPHKMVEVSEDEERQVGASFDAWARENLEIVEDPLVMGFINDLGQTMVRTIEPQPFVYRFRVIRDDRLNAFAAPGGYVYFHSATILRAGRLDEVAGVMAHEIAHVKARHYKRGVEKNAIPALLIQAAAIGVTAATGHPAPMIVGMGLNVAVQLRYSREFEEEADRFGSVFATRAGYDVRGMSRFFERIVAEQRPGSARIPPYLYTHPDVEERIANVEALAEDLRPVATPGRALARAFRDARARLALLAATERTLWRRPLLPADKARSDPALERAETLAARGDLETALAVLRGAERAAPLDPRPPFRRGELLEEMGRLGEAIAAYRRAVELDPTTGLVLYKLGRAYARVGDRHRAVYYLEQARFHLGETSAVRRRAEQAIAALEFPVVTEAGLAEEFDDVPVRGRTHFPSGGQVVWWARIGQRHMEQRERIRVRWIDPDGALRAEAPVRSRRRPYVEARLSLADAVADPERPWTVEAVLDDDVVDRREFRILWSVD